MWPRRALLGAALLAGGCGFRPLYGPAAPDGAPAALAGVQVANIPERTGQLLRQALVRRLDPRGLGGAPRHELRVTLAIENEPIGFRRDGAPSRIRATARGDWRLVTLGAPQREVAAGREQVFDAANIPDGQFFAADVSRDAMERRLMEQLADRIVQRLAVTPLAGG
ncbi:MAG: LPS assembly lipoprotein LptE [Acetobacteraceae bacterium]|nr:LPS assembly lipoprotein LptE [Acetobacteraceae bacterium]MCX7685397.1 LPS assembly lipoprotein LptE [Acetobacteraceae bacterium]MDW8398936.1 LPS assembly lipoprotein LptE [Acetobacteraceae bacterium]